MTILKFYRLFWSFTFFLRTVKTRTQSFQNVFWNLIITHIQNFFEGFYILSEIFLLIFLPLHWLHFFFKFSSSSWTRRTILAKSTSSFSKNESNKNVFLVKFIFLQNKMGYLMPGLLSPKKFDPSFYSEKTILCHRFWCLDVRSWKLFPLATRRSTFCPRYGLSIAFLVEKLFSQDFNQTFAVKS